MKSFEAIRKQLLGRVNNLRRTQRVIDLPEFESVWETLTVEESASVEAMIQLCQSERLEAWLKSKCRKTLDEMTLKELRNLAKVHSIPYYGEMNKATLIWEIHNADDRAASRRDETLVRLGQNPN